MKMRKLLLILMCSNITNAYAISCPNNGKILDTGYTLEQVTQICGQPASQKQYQKMVNSSEELVYDKNNLGASVKVTLTFSYGRLSNIHLLGGPNLTGQTCQSTNQLGETINIPCPPQEQNLTTSGICGPLIQNGYTVAQVRSVCGAPTSEKVISSTSTDIQELNYGGTASENILVFENGKLADWKN